MRVREGDAHFKEWVNTLAADIKSSISMLIDTYKFSVEWQSQMIHALFLSQVGSIKRTAVGLEFKLKTDEAPSESLLYFVDRGFLHIESHKEHPYGYMVLSSGHANIHFSLTADQQKAWKQALSNQAQGDTELIGLLSRFLRKHAEFSNYFYTDVFGEAESSKINYKSFPETAVSLFQEIDQIDGDATKLRHASPLLQKWLEDLRKIQQSASNRYHPVEVR